MLTATLARMPGTSSGCIVPIYSGDPALRTQELIFTSENLRMIVEEWQRIWFLDQPSHLTPYPYAWGHHLTARDRLRATWPKLTNWRDTSRRRSRATPRPARWPIAADTDRSFPLRVVADRLPADTLGSSNFAALCHNADPRAVARAKIRSAAKFRRDR